MEGALKTHTGKIRQINEDSGEILQKDGMMLAVVADGMGGHRAGDVASQMSITKFKERFYSIDVEDYDHINWIDWLRETVQEANQYIYQYAQEHEGYEGMGTTIVVALFLQDHFYVAHVGDSRVYRLIPTELEVITEDHSLVNELLRTGQITKEEAESHPQRNIITRALGTDDQVEVDVQKLSYMDHQQVLLCTDGLTNMVSEEQMIQILSSDQDLESKTTSLLQLALDAGGDDNVTVVLVMNNEAHLEEK